MPQARSVLLTHGAEEGPALPPGRSGQDDPHPRREHRGQNDPPSDDRIIVSVSHELAPKLGGAILDFGSHNKMERFVWLTMPAVKSRPARAFDPSEPGWEAFAVP